MSAHLQVRLRNCLQTILELEPRMEQLNIYPHFQENMKMLKHSMAGIDKLQLSEDEVLRLEKATTTFLDELWLPLHKNSVTEPTKKVLQ